MNSAISPGNDTSTASRDELWDALWWKLHTWNDLDAAFAVRRGRFKELLNEKEMSEKAVRSGQVPKRQVEELIWEIDLFGQEDFEIEEAVPILDELRVAARTHDLVAAKRDWARLASLLSWYNDGIFLTSPFEREIEGLLAAVDETQSRPIYRLPGDEHLEAGVRLVTRVNQYLVDQIATHPRLLHTLSPRAFEELLADIFSSFGYRVELTAPTRDGGKDIVAVRTDHSITSKLIIECKKYAASRRVGIALVRELYAVKQLERATKAIMATTTTFSPDARSLEAQHLYELELKDFQAVSEWARTYSQWLDGIRQ